MCGCACVLCNLTQQMLHERGVHVCITCEEQVALVTLFCLCHHFPARRLVPLHSQASACRFSTGSTALQQLQPPLPPPQQQVLVVLVVSITHWRGQQPSGGASVSCRALRDRQVLQVGWLHKGGRQGGPSLSLSGQGHG